jgi:hypothetical protein
LGNIYSISQGKPCQLALQAKALEVVRSINSGNLFIHLLLLLLINKKLAGDHISFPKKIVWIGIVSILFVFLTLLEYMFFFIVMIFLKLFILFYFFFLFCRDL